MPDQSAPTRAAYGPALTAAADAARDHLDRLPDRPVGPPSVGQRVPTDPPGPLPADGTPAAEVVASLVARMEQAVVASNGPRYFGFVTGGTLPAALAADWLVSAWDQNTALAVMSPGAARLEEEAGAWILDLLGLPSTAGFAFVTGATMANFTALATARHHLLTAVGWDLARDGLQGAPPLTVVVGEERHVTVDLALRYLGIGSSSVVPVDVDAQGRMEPGALGDALRRASGPTIVCAQAGNVNTGAIDPLEPIADLSGGAGAWLHVDGAFGLWAAASPRRRAATLGVERADSLVTDAHKWLNVPYDCGVVMTRHPASQRAAMSTGAAYLAAGEGRDAMAWGPEFSRRARGITVWAALQSLGRNGVAALVDRCCELAGRMADTLRDGGLHIANEVSLNQVLVRFETGAAAHDDRRTAALVEAVQRDGTCWAGGTTWQGRAAMRLSVSGWMTGPDDIDRSAAAILQAAAAVAEA